MKESWNRKPVPDRRYLTRRAQGTSPAVLAIEDRLSSLPTWRLTGGFGPSLHFLILDQHALSIHQGIGFAPRRFDQTLSFTVVTVF